METLRCPLCYISVECGVIDHLRRDHRRTEFEARTLVERSKEGILGWNAQNARQKVRSSLASAKIALPCANLACRLLLPVPSPLGPFGFW